MNNFFILFWLIIIILSITKILSFNSELYIIIIFSFFFIFLFFLLIQLINKEHLLGITNFILLIIITSFLLINFLIKIKIYQKIFYLINIKYLNKLNIIWKHYSNIFFNNYNFIIFFLWFTRFSYYKLVKFYVYLFNSWLGVKNFNNFIFFLNKIKWKLV